MKYIGYILISIGLALLLFVAYNYFKGQDKMASPIPEENGIKVIFVTPTP